MIDPIDSISNDGTNLFSETGHKLYTEAIKRAWPHLTILPMTKDVNELPVFDEEHYQKATIVSIQDSMLSTAWPYAKDEDLDERVKKVMPSIRLAKPGEQLKFKMKGIAFGFCDIVGPDGCELEIKVDGELLEVRDRFDTYCFYSRSTFFVSHLDEHEQVHEIEITVRALSKDKKEILKDNLSKCEEPLLLEQDVWKVGEMLILGELA
jgi:hypothetical protein